MARSGRECNGFLRVDPLFASGKFPDPRMASPIFPRRLRGGPVGVGDTDNRRNPRKSENVCSTRFYNILQFQILSTVLCPMEQNTVRWPRCGVVLLKPLAFTPLELCFGPSLSIKAIKESLIGLRHCPSTSQQLSSCRSFNCLPTLQ